MDFAPSLPVPVPADRSRVRQPVVPALAGLITLLLVAGIVGLVLVGGSTEQVLKDVEPIAAVRNAPAATNAESFRMKMQVSSPFGGSPVVQECTFHPAGGRSRCEVKGVLDLVVIGTQEGEVYVQRAGAATWQRLRGPEVTAIGGDSVQFGNALVQGLAEVGTVTDLGVDEIGGVAVRHYRATVKDVPLPEPSGGSAGLGGAGVESDVWLDAEGRLRRQVMSLSAAGVKVETRVDLSDFGKVPAIELPPASAVVDATADQLHLLFRP